MSVRRHLAHLQTKVGYKVKEDVPGLDGPEADALYATGAAWLKGKLFDSLLRGARE